MFFINTEEKSLLRLDSEKQESLVFILLLYVVGLEGMKEKILKPIEWLCDEGIFNKYNIEISKIPKSKSDLLKNRALFGILKCCKWPEKNILEQFWPYDIDNVKKLLDLLIINHSTSSLWYQDTVKYPIEKKKSLYVTLYEWGAILDIKGDGFMALSAKFIEKDWESVSDSIIIGILDGLNKISPSIYNNAIKKNLKLLEKNQINMLSNYYTNQ